jgi:hypothetical protein
MLGAFITMGQNISFLADLFSFFFTQTNSVIFQYLPFKGNDFSVKTQDLWAFQKLNQKAKKSRLEIL